MLRALAEDPLPNPIDTMPKPQNHDDYIAAAADFAVPILTKLRAIVHEACPDVEETMRWSTPHFDVNGALASMAAFKGHVTFGFWRGVELDDPEGRLVSIGSTKMAGVRIESLRDIPPKRVLARWLKEAVHLNSAPKPAVRKKAKKKVAREPAPQAPADFLAALKKKPKALATFDGFSPTNKKEYVEWVTEAKRDATREKRIAQAVEWMAEGKPRNWKYMKEWA